MGTKFRRGLVAALVTGVTLGAASMASAITLEISITNNSSSGGVTLTPLWVGVHDGTFDTFNNGEMASPALEALAEDGDVMPIRQAFAMAQPGGSDGVIAAPGGFPGAPLIEPGETGMIELSVDGISNRFLSFLSMILPSNDQFIGNGDPMVHELFDAGGNFLGPQSFEVTGLQAYDSGTEANVGDGAPFQAAFGGPAQDEGGVVTNAPGIDIFAGITLPNGNVLTDIDYAGNGDYSIATVSVAAVPVPAALPLMLGGLSLIGFAARRRSA